VFFFKKPNILRVFLQIEVICGINDKVKAKTTPKSRVSDFLSSCTFDMKKVVKAQLHHSVTLQKLHLSIPPPVALGW
jgi:hypothetical protein